MSLLSSFRRRRKSASVAKDRLQIIIAQERSNLDSQDYLPMLREEILAVIAKYTQVNRDQVRVDLQRRDNSSVLELNVMLPDKDNLSV